MGVHEIKSQRDQQLWPINCKRNLSHSLKLTRERAVNSLLTIPWKTVKKSSSHGKGEGTNNYGLEGPFLTQWQLCK